MDDFIFSQFGDSEEKKLVMGNIGEWLIQISWTGIKVTFAPPKILFRN
jgi:hypothetical protein